MRVLIVDDCQEIAESFATLLESRGHHCVAAVSEGEAREALKSRGPFDVAIIDWWLQEGGDGANLLRWMRQSGDMTPAALITAAGDMDFVAADAVAHSVPKALAARKPLFPETLIALLETLGRV